MAPLDSSCALLADRHTVLADGVRGLLEADFETVYTVADEPSLRRGAQQLAPALIVLDLALAGLSSIRLLQDLHEVSPASRIIVLSVHDDAAVARMAFEAGADGVVLKRSIAHDFLSAVSAVLRGERFVSPDIEGVAPVS